MNIKDAIEESWREEEKPKNKNSKIWRGYLPMDCPNCGRHRLCLYGDLIEGSDELGYMYIFCEKCDFKTEDREH